MLLAFRKRTQGQVQGDRASFEIAISLSEILAKEGKRLKNKVRPQVTDVFVPFLRRRVKRNQKRAGKDNMPPRILLFSLAA